MFYDLVSIDTTNNCPDKYCGWGAKEHRYEPSLANMIKSTQIHLRTHLIAGIGFDLQSFHYIGNGGKTIDTVNRSSPIYLLHITNSKSTNDSYDHIDDYSFTYSVAIIKLSSPTLILFNSLNPVAITFVAILRD